MTHVGDPLVKRLSYTIDLPFTFFDSDLLVAILYADMENPKYIIKFKKKVPNNTSWLYFNPSCVIFKRVFIYALHTQTFLKRVHKKFLTVVTPGEWE